MTTPADAARAAVAEAEVAPTLQGWIVGSDSWVEMVTARILADEQGER